MWLARGRSLLEQPAWTSAPELPALKLLLRAEIEKLFLLIPALLLSCEKGELRWGEANKTQRGFQCNRWVHIQMCLFAWDMKWHF